MLTSTHFTSNSYDERIFSYENMYFFTKICILYNDEIAVFDLLSLSPTDMIPSWLFISDVQETETDFAMYKNEKSKFVNLNIDNIVFLKLISYDNPQIMTGISLLDAKCLLDGILVRSYSSESAKIDSLFNNKPCKYVTSNEYEYVYENFFTNNNTNVHHQIKVI
jgi:hypothetical protein